MSVILGCDSSLSNFGWAVAVLDSDGVLAFKDAGVIKTEPGAAARKGDDATLRVQKIYRELLALSREWRPNIIAVEGLAVPFGRTSMKTVQQCARARTVVDCVAVNRGSKLFERSPQAVKKAATGRGSGSKDAVIIGIGREYPELADLLAALPSSDVEHAADAAAVVHACLPAMRGWGEQWE